MSEWQPIKSAPKDGTKVLLCDDRQALVVVAGYSKHFSLWLSGDHVITEPTHWMSIPAIPCQQPLRRQP